MHRGFWCPQKDSNFRPLPYQGSALPLSYVGFAGRAQHAIVTAAGQASPADCKALKSKGFGGRFQATMAHQDDDAPNETPATARNRALREARLAEALRANLKRRKAQATRRASPPPDAPDPEDTP